MVAAGLFETGNTDQALDLLYQTVRPRLTEGHIEEVRELLCDAKRVTLPTSALLALLTITGGHKDEFVVERQDLADIVGERTPERAERLLRGLR